MGLFHLDKIFGIKIRESADDGSDFSNPDADYRMLFLGEDGDLHLKDSSGTVTDIGGTAATFVGASAYKDASQTISNDTVTALLLDTEDYDTNTFHDTGSNTSRMTIPTAMDGKYLLTGHAYYDSNTSGQRQLFFRKNGNPVGPTCKIAPISGDNFYSVSHVLSLVATDYVELATYQDSGGNRTIGDPSSFGDRYKVRLTISLL